MRPTAAALAAALLTASAIACEPPLAGAGVQRIDGGGHVVAWRSPVDFSPQQRQQILSFGPWPPPFARDPSNHASGNAAAIALGARLFFDARLSPIGYIACVSCHQPDRSWTDGKARAHGLADLPRNTPALANLRLQRWFGWGGGADSLWMASLRPLLDPREFDSGRHGDLQRLRASPYNLLGRYSDDGGRTSATATRHAVLEPRHWGEFRVPGLRNVAVTAPYMHDGSIPTLRDVVLHYSKLDESRIHSSAQPLLRPLGLSTEEVDALVAFLETLTDAAGADRPRPRLDGACADAPPAAARGRKQRRLGRQSSSTGAGARLQPRPRSASPAAGGSA